MKKFTLSIKWLFVLIILKVAIGISLINFLFSYIHHERHLNIHFSTISSLFQKEIENIIKPVESFLYNIQGLLCCKILDFKDVENTNQFLMNFMDKYPYVTSINYGDKKGNGYLILNDRGKWLNRIKKPEDKDFVTWHEINSNGKIISSRKIKDSYDPRETIWYKQAIKNQAIQWTEEYLFRTTKDPGITASLILCSEEQKVVGVDIMIKDFSTFLEKIKEKNPYKDSFLYLFSEKHVIASTDKTNFKPGKIYSITQEDFPLLYNALLNINNSRELYYFNFSGQTWIAKREKLNLGNRELSILIILPKVVITKELKLYLFYQLLVSMFLSFLVLVYITKKYMNPLIDISQNIKNFGIKEITLKNLTQRTDEIGILSKSISQASSEILESKRMLEESEKKCRTISNLAPVGIYLIDYENEKIIEANFTGLSMLGYSLDELKGKSLSEIFPSETLRELREINQKESIETLCNVFDKEGNKLECRIKAIKLIFKDKSYMLMSADDITEIRKIEKKIQEAEQFETVRHSLGEAVHRFKDLINVIHGFATIAKTRDTNDFVKNALDQILNASKRAIYLTKELLTVTADRKYDKQIVDLNALILSMKTKIHAFMGESINVVFELQDKPITVNFDVEAFDEVMTNLLSNAKDAMPKGGILKIKTEISPLLDKNFALLSISDTGVGMDEETKKRAFEPFFTKKGASGTGLGLSIVYKIIKDHEGFIEVESELNKGTTFKIYLPLSSIVT